MKSTFKDVNRETYLKALFLDLKKQAKMVDFPDMGQLIHDFVLNNPTNSQQKYLTKADDLVYVNGAILVTRKKKAKKK